MNEYILPEGTVVVTDLEYGKILKALESEINILKFSKESKLCQVALEKFLEYYQIIKCIVSGEAVTLI